MAKEIVSELRDWFVVSPGWDIKWTETANVYSFNITKYTSIQSKLIGKQEVVLEVAGTYVPVSEKSSPLCKSSFLVDVFATLYLGTDKRTSVIKLNLGVYKTHQWLMFKEHTCNLEALATKMQAMFSDAREFFGQDKDR